MTTTLLNGKIAGYVAHKIDGSEIATGGYRSGSGPKVYTSKGHATAAANRKNRGTYRYNTVTRKYDYENKNEWTVSAVKLVTQEDELKAALRTYLTTNGNMTDGAAVDTVLADLLKIINTNA